VPLSAGSRSSRFCCRTVQLYFDSIRAKLNANTREEAVTIAISRGLIGLQD